MIRSSVSLCVFFFINILLTLVRYYDCVSHTHRYSLGPMVPYTMVNLSMDNAKVMENTNLLTVGNTLAPGMVAVILDLVLALGKVRFFFFLEREREYGQSCFLQLSMDAKPLEPEFFFRWQTLPWRMAQRYGSWQRYRNLSQWHYST